MGRGLLMNTEKGTSNKPISQKRKTVEFSPPLRSVDDMFTFYVIPETPCVPQFYSLPCIYSKSLLLCKRLKVMN